jgi:hypothetical protein
MPFPTTDMDGHARLRERVEAALDRAVETASGRTGASTTEGLLCLRRARASTRVNTVHLTAGATPGGIPDLVVQMGSRATKLAR